MTGFEALIDYRPRVSPIQTLQPSHLNSRQMLTQVTADGAGRATVGDIKSLHFTTYAADCLTYQGGGRDNGKLPVGELLSGAGMTRWRVAERNLFSLLALALCSLLPALSGESPYATVLVFPIADWACSPCAPAAE